VTSYLTEPEHCSCPCHSGAIMFHFAPCCERCPNCDAPIASHMWAAHRKHCDSPRARSKQEKRQRKWKQEHS
jgi:hypothetical protein